MSAFDSLFSNEVFETAFGATFVYSRGSTDSTITAMDSRISNELQMEYGASLVTESKEFVIKLSSISEDFMLPERGDTITDVNGAVWEVSKIGSAPDWEFDNDREYIRIRAVLIGG